MRKRVFGGQYKKVGFMVIPREHLECLGDDHIETLFEFDKRQTIAGFNTCFDHSKYLTYDEQMGEWREDVIRYTKLDVCHK
jgi:hypothetical protein